MRITGIEARTVPISRYADPSIASGNLTTTAVVIATDQHRDGNPVTGFGFASIGRFACTGLIHDRFATRLLDAGELADPFDAWNRMMSDEKPGGHGERCIAVGALDMAVWDAFAKTAGEPLYRYLRQRLGRPMDAPARIFAYAGGGYYYPSRDIERLTDEVRGFVDRGYTLVKIKIGGVPLAEDLRRIEAVLTILPKGSALAVDAMNRYSREFALEAARALEPYGLAWFEDVIDPLDFEGHADLASVYSPPLAIGEATFSHADGRNLIRYAGLRRNHDRLLFDPAHCYGIPEFVRIVELFEAAGWDRRSFLPHGGHLYSLHVAAALGLGGTEDNPDIFQPFGGFADGYRLDGGYVMPPDAPGIGFESRSRLDKLFQSLMT